MMTKTQMKTPPTMAVVTPLLASVLLILLATGQDGAEAQTVVDTFPYLETFDGFDLCGDTSCPVSGECTDLGGGSLGAWTQEQGGGLNWAVADHALAGCGSGPVAGDHTGSGGAGKYMWIHQGEFEECDDSAINSMGCNNYFFEERIGLISPQFSFADVPPGVGINLRYFTFTHGIRTGTMSLWSSTNGTGGPWAELRRVPGDKKLWLPQTVSLSEYRGEPSVHLRFLAEMLPDSGEIDGGRVPDPDAQADQALDDVNVFLGNASATPPGSEDRATWVDLSTRFGISSSLLNRQHVAGWSAAQRTMTTLGGLNQQDAFVKTLQSFDYMTKRWTKTTELVPGTDPLPRRRSAAAPSGDGEAMLVYGGEESIGPVPTVLRVDHQTHALTPLACTNLVPNDTDPNHDIFPSEGATATATDTSGEILVFGGRGLVIQLNFITRYTVTPAPELNCTYEAVRASSGPPPPRSRWGHVAAFWRDPSSGAGHLFGHGGKFQPSPTDPTLLLADTAVFDLDAEEWLELRTLDPEQQPSRRAFHSAVKNREGDKMVIYGGLDDTDPSDVVYHSDAFVLLFDTEFVIWKRLEPVGDPAVPRAQHTMLPLFFADTTLGANTDNEEGFLVFGGATEGGVTTDNVAKLNFGTLALAPPPSDGGTDDDEDPTVAIALGVILPFCCLLALLVLFLVALVAGLLTWMGLAKRRIRKKYAVDQRPATDEEIGTAMAEIHPDSD